MHSVERRFDHDIHFLKTKHFVVQTKPKFYVNYPFRSKQRFCRLQMVRPSPPGNSEGDPIRRDAVCVFGTWKNSVDVRSQLSRIIN